MSSEYRILCLSHNPVITAGADQVHWGQPEPAIAAIRDRTGPAAEHPHCRLMVGRYSYSLIELCCPARSHPNCLHSSDEWADRTWLVLLALATPAAITTAGPIWCWTSVIDLLRGELGLAVADG